MSLWKDVKFAFKNQSNSGRIRQNPIGIRFDITFGSGLHRIGKLFLIVSSIPSEQKFTSAIQVTFDGSVNVAFCCQIQLNQM